MNQDTLPPSQPQQPAQPYGQPQYPAPYPPQYGQPYPMQPKTNTMAILSLVFAFLFSVLGIIFGFVALGQLKDPKRNETGRGLAIAGIVIGFLAFIPVIIIIILTLMGPLLNSTFDSVIQSI